MRPARLAKLIVMIVLIVLVARMVHLDALARAMEPADPLLLAAAVALALGDRALMIAKWYPLLRAQVALISVWRAARAYLAAGFASLVLPASVGADVLRAVALGRRHGVVAEVGASIVMERLLGMVASSVPALLALAIVVRNHMPLGILLPWVLAVLAVALAALLLPLSRRAMSVADRLLGRYRHGRWGSLAHRFAAAYGTYRRYPRTLACVGAASVVEQFVPVLVQWTISRALGTQISLSMLLVAVPLVLFVTRLPISVGGIGVGEAAEVYVLSIFGVPPVQALALALTARLVELAGLLPGAVLWYDLVAASHRRSPRPEPASEGGLSAPLADAPIAGVAAPVQPLAAPPAAPPGRA